MPAAKQTEAYLLRGCQSQVWIDSEFEDGKLVFEADSDAHIVRGLLAIVLAAFNQKPSPVSWFQTSVKEIDTLVLKYVTRKSYRSQYFV